MFKNAALLCALLLSYGTSADMIVSEYKNGNCGAPAAKSNTWTKNSGCQNFVTGTGSVRVHNTGINSQHIQFYHDHGCGDGLGQRTIKPGQSSCYVQTNGATGAGYTVGFIYENEVEVAE